MPNTTTPKTISATEAKARFGEWLHWIDDSQGTVIITRHGKPVAAILSHAEYAQIQQLRKREQRRKAREALDALRDEARLRNPNLSAEAAYRLAGFSDEVIQELLEADAASPSDPNA